MMYEFGEILLLNFPFTNVSDSKKRPALVILNTNDGDVLVARITSRIYKTPFDVLLNDWQSSGLLIPSCVRLHKLATIDSSLIQKRLGALSDLAETHKKLSEIVAQL